MALQKNSFLKHLPGRSSGGGLVILPRACLTSLLGFKPTKIRSFTVKTRVKQVLGSYTSLVGWLVVDP